MKSGSYHLQQNCTLFNCDSGLFEIILKHIFELLQMKTVPSYFNSQTATPHVMSSQHGIYRTVSALVSLRFPSRFCEKLQRENTLEHVLEHCEART